MPEAASFTLDEIREGLEASFDAMITTELVDAFASLSGDRSPLHTDDAFARLTPFSSRIPHGMIAGAFFSRLIGMHLPGRHALYLSQSLSFKQPLPLEGSVTVRGKVKQISNATRTILIKTEVVDSAGLLLASGEAMVRLLK